MPWNDGIVSKLGDVPFPHLLLLQFPQTPPKNHSSKMELQGSWSHETVCALDSARSGLQSLLSHVLAARGWTSAYLLGLICSCAGWGALSPRVVVRVTTRRDDMA